MLDPTPTPASKNPAGVDDLVRRWQNEGDAAARDKLVREYRGFIWSVTSQLARNQGFDFDDCHQYGVLGFLHALDKYVPEQTALTTYAASWIRSVPLRELKQERVAVSVPSHVHGDYARIKRIIRDLERRGQTPTPAAIAPIAGMVEIAVERAMRTGSGSFCSSLDVSGSNGEGESNSTWLDSFAGTEESRPDRIIESSMTAAAVGNAIEGALGRLTDREREVYGLRFVEERTLKSCGEVMGCTRERVRQIEVKIREKLTRALKYSRPCRDMLEG